MKEKNSSEIILISDENEMKSIQNENIENNEIEMKFDKKDEKEVEGSDAGADGVSGKDRGLYNLSFHTEFFVYLCTYLFMYSLID